MFHIIAAVIWNKNSPNVPTLSFPSFSTWTTSQLILLWLSVLAAFVGAIMIIIGFIQWYNERKIRKRSIIIENAFEGEPVLPKAEDITYVKDPVTNNSITITQLKEKCMSMSYDDFIKAMTMPGGSVYAKYCGDIFLDKV